MALAESTVSRIVLTPGRYNVLAPIHYSGILHTRGGGVAIIGARVTLRDCRLMSNFALDGGAVYAFGNSQAWQTMAWPGIYRPGIYLMASLFERNMGFFYAAEGDSLVKQCTFRDHHTQPISPIPNSAILALTPLTMFCSLGTWNLPTGVIPNQPGDFSDCTEKCIAGRYGHHHNITSSSGCALCQKGKVHAPRL